VIGCRSVHLVTHRRTNENAIGWAEVGEKPKAMLKLNKQASLGVNTPQNATLKLEVYDDVKLHEPTLSISETVH